MIKLPENISIDMRKISHAKDLNELWDDDTDAFIFGIYNPRVLTYINNINLKKKNPDFFYDFMNIRNETRCYKDKMQELMDNYIQDGNESPIGVVNHVLDNIEYEYPEDRLKLAYVLGNYVRFNLVK